MMGHQEQVQCSLVQGICQSATVVSMSVEAVNMNGFQHKCPIFYRGQQTCVSDLNLKKHWVKSNSSKQIDKKTNCILYWHCFCSTAFCFGNVSSFEITRHSPGFRELNDSASQQHHLLSAERKRNKHGNLLASFTQAAVFEIFCDKQSHAWQPRWGTPYQSNDLYLSCILHIQIYLFFLIHTTKKNISHQANNILF